MSKNTPSEPRLPKDRKDHPVTMGVFEEHRQEMRAFESWVRAKFEGSDKRFDAVDKRFDAVDKRFDAVDKRFDELSALMSSGFEEMKQLYRNGLVRIEEMQHENRLMAEHLNTLFHRQKRVEDRIDHFEGNLRR